MKLNWGVKIALTYGIFVVIILAMVAFSMTKDIDLVSNKYYDEEIQYQEKIDDISRTGRLSEQVSFTVANSVLTIQFPKAMENGKIVGKLLLYRPSDFKKDKRILIKLNGSNQMIVDLSGLEKGLWKLKADWKFNDVKYYNEETINLQ